MAPIFVLGKNFQQERHFTIHVNTSGSSVRKISEISRIFNFLHPWLSLIVIFPKTSFNIPQAQVPWEGHYQKVDSWCIPSLVEWQTI